MDPINEPVVTGATLEGAVHALLLSTFALLEAFDVWRPSPEQLSAIAGVYAAFVVVVKYGIAAWQRSKVTPVAKADAAVAVVEQRAAAVEASAVQRVQEARQDGATTVMRALTADDVKAATAAVTGVSVHDMRHENGEPVVAPPPGAGDQQPPPPPPPPPPAVQSFVPSGYVAIPLSPNLPRR